MTSDSLGMDVDGAQRQLNILESDALGGVSKVLTTMPGIMSDLKAAWKGPDADHFSSDWEQHLANLHAVQRALHDIVTELRQAISAQRNTSAS